MEILKYFSDNGVKGAIFDMDGTLTDSMEKWGEIYALLGKRLGAELPGEIIMKYNHYSMRGCAEKIIGDFCLNADVEAVYGGWLGDAVKYYENIFKIRPYMLETLKALNRAGVKCAIATASDGACARAFIAGNKLEEYILSVTSLDEVKRPKSYPDIYLKAAAKLNLNPDECIVFEDALIAVKSAKSGGFKVCGVRDVCSAGDEKGIKAYADFTLGFER